MTDEVCVSLVDCQGFKFIDFWGFLGPTSNSRFYLMTDDIGVH